MSGTIKALAEILRKAQGVEDRETRKTIDVGYECVTIRDEHDAMRKEIERLREEKVALISAKAVTINPSPMPEGQMIDYLRQTIDRQNQDIARLRDEGQKDYDGMREFQLKFIHASHEIERLGRLLQEPSQRRCRRCNAEGFQLTEGLCDGCYERGRETMGDQGGSYESLSRHYQSNYSSSRLALFKAGLADPRWNDLAEIATKRGARMQVMKAWMLLEADDCDTWTQFVRAHPEAAEWFDENGIPR